MTEILIAGGGLAGAAAACLLARAGRDVTVIERHAQPTDKICGEFLSAEAQHYLRHLGLDPAKLGAHPIHAVRLISGARTATAALPFPALGLSRRILDEALLHHAAGSGATIHRGHQATLTQYNPTTIEVQATQYTPRTLFLATGKQDLRGLRRTTPTPPDLVGFKLHLRLAPAQRAALAGHVDLMLLAGGYAGMQLIDNGHANLCLLIDRTRLHQAGNTWDTLLEHLLRTEPHLRHRLAGATPLTPPLSIYRVPYGFLHHAHPTDAPNIYRLGDQCAVIPSFTGDGMSIALHTATLAATHHLAQKPAADYHARMRADLAKLIARATALYRLGSTTAGPTLMIHLARLWPGLLSLTARATRVPRRAIEGSKAREGFAPLDPPLRAQPLEPFI